VDVRTNAFGMRGGDVEVEKEPGTYRIVVIGDSFTMGWGVAEPDTWARVLEKRLNARAPCGLPLAARYEVLNLGVGNYNAAQEVALLRKVGLGLHPDLVIMGSFINDAEPISHRWRPALLRRSWLAALVYTRFRRLWFHDPRTLDYRQYYRGLYQKDRPGWVAERQAWHDLGALSRETGIPVVVYLFPELHDVSATYPFLDVHAKLERLGADAGLPVIDLLPRFAGIARADSLWVSPADAHPNARANAIFASSICRTLADAIRHTVAPDDALGTFAPKRQTGPGACSGSRRVACGR